MTAEVVEAQSQSNQADSAACRARLGFIYPADNSIFKHDVLALLPSDVKVSFAPLKPPLSILQAGRIDIDHQLKNVSLATNVLLRCREFDVACLCEDPTAAITDFASVHKALRSAVPSALTSSVHTAIRRALRAISAKRLVLATDQRTDNNKTKLVYEAMGFQVLSAKSFSAGSPNPAEALSGVAIRDFIFSIDRADAQAIVISSTTLPAMEIIDEIETIVGKPVLCLNQMLVWDALRSTAVSDKIQGYGKLLREH